MINNKAFELAALVTNIQSNFPSLPIQTVKKLGEGMRSVAILVNEEWVFRFPKEEQGAADLNKEIIILPELTKSVTLAIPQFEYIGKADHGLPFVGYCALPGVIVGEDAVPSLPSDMKEKMARQIAQFIDEVSAFPIHTARKLGVKEIDIRTSIVALFQETKSILNPILEPEIRKYITSRFEDFLVNPAHFMYVPTLIHADLSPDHFLMDPINRELTGIIDFGDMHIGDPDYEYVYLVQDCGIQFTRRVIQWRGQGDIEERLNKVSFFVSFDHLQYAIEGLHRNEHEWVQAGLRAIRLEMKLNDR